jgi:hypothetical protein
MHKMYSMFPSTFSQTLVVTEKPHENRHNLSGPNGTIFSTFSTVICLNSTNRPHPLNFHMYVSLNPIQTRAQSAYQPGKAKNEGGPYKLHRLQRVRSPLQTMLSRLPRLHAVSAAASGLFRAHAPLRMLATREDVMKLRNIGISAHIDSGKAGCFLSFSAPYQLESSLSAFRLIQC